MRLESRLVNNMAREKLIVAHLGRVLLASLFILGGVNKLTIYTQTLDRMNEVGLLAVEILLPLTILLEIGGGLLVAMGRNFARLSALILALFALSTNYFFHDFWSHQGHLRTLELSLFFKNIAISGGLIMVASGLFSANSVSLDPQK